MQHLLRLGLLILLITVAATLFADNEPPQHQSLPIGLTEEEMTRLDEIGKNHISTDAPTGAIRNPAEWEPSQGVIIRYPLGIPVSIVAEMSEDLVVTTIVSSTYYQNQAISTYTSGGVNMANVDWLIASTNSYWTRDYGPWFIFEDKEMAIVDHIYNRPRPYDDVIPQHLGTEWGMTVYGMDLTHTGGNHMSDGLGMSMSTKLVYNENSIPNYRVDSLMEAYLGNDYTVLDYIESGGIHHIDCWAKFLNPTTILVKDVPTGSSSKALLDARAAYLATQISAWGQPYTVVRVYCPYGTAYTNSIILNDKVLVPTFNSSWDDDAIATYEAAMPGYEVIGFTGSWLDDDAIHCRTMGVPDRYMLRIHHIPLVEVADSITGGYEIGARVDACSDELLIADSLKIFYSVDDGPWMTTTMGSTIPGDSVFGSIPVQPGGSTVKYYLQVADYSGRVETHPFIGAPWAHEFEVLETNIAPSITSPDSMLCFGGDDFVFTPEFTDPDDTTHTITFANYPAWLSVQNDSLVGTAPQAYETSEITVIVDDSHNADSLELTLTVFICGDLNGDGTGPNVVDLTYLVTYMFSGGPAPVVMDAADINGEAGVNVADLTYLVSYLFNGGNLPDCP